MNYMRLWLVDYTFRFSSSSGMDQYKVDKRETCHVATFGFAVTDLQRVIQHKLGGQTVVLLINNATYLGDIIVERI